MSKFPSGRVGCLRLIPSTNNDYEFWTPFPFQKKKKKSSPVYLMALEYIRTVKEGKHSR